MPCRIPPTAVPQQHDMLSQLGGLCSATAFFFQEQDDPKCPQGTVLSDAQAENFIGWPTEAKRHRQESTSLAATSRLAGRATNWERAARISLLPASVSGQGASLSGFPVVLQDLKRHTRLAKASHVALVPHCTFTKSHEWFPDRCFGHLGCRF